MKYLVSFFDNPNKRILTGITSKNDNDFFDKNLYIECNKFISDYLTILNEKMDIGLGYIYVDKQIYYLSEKNQLQFNENLNDDEIKDVVRENFLLKARHLLDTRLINNNLIMYFYDFIICKEKLKIHGYDISYQNESEIMKKILNEDKDNINLIEDYLYAKNFIDEKYLWYKYYKDFMIKSQGLSYNELEVLYNEYKEKF